MKNLLFLSIATLTLASCGNTSAEAEAPKNDSVAVVAVDTTAVVATVDSVAAALPTATETKSNTTTETAHSTTTVKK